MLSKIELLMKVKIVLLSFIGLILQSCISQTPENYFVRAVFNINSSSYFGSGELNELITGKENKSLLVYVDGEFIMQDNATLYVESWKIVEVENKIEDIKELKPTEDTKEMLDRSLKLFNFVLEKYKTDYIDIAKLIDSGVSKSDIDSAIVNFDNATLPEFQKLYDSVIEVGIPYAEANGIDVSY